MRKVRITENDARHKCDAKKNDLSILSIDDSVDFRSVLVCLHLRALSREYSQNSTVDWSNLLHYVANIPEIDLKSIEEAPYDSRHWSEMID